MKKNNFDFLEKDFKVFERGIDRLDQLKKELNSLNTKGFEKEKAKIESELHNITDIPKIEIQLKVLKQKINGNNKSNVGKVRKKSVKKIRANKLRKIDKGVDELVKSKLDKIASDLKVSISERVKDKECKLIDLSKQKEKELFSMFNKKEIDLKNKYSKIYDQKVNSELSKKVKKEFNKKLSQRYNSKKESLVLDLENKLKIKEKILRKHVNADLRRYKSQERKKLSEKYLVKERNLNHKLKDDFELLKERLTKSLKDKSN